MPRWSISPSWSSANTSHGLSTGTGPVDSPPLALRWSIVMQRKSFFNASIAFGQLLVNVYTRAAWLHSGRKSAMIRSRGHEPPVHPHTRHVGHAHLVRGDVNDVGTATATADAADH